MRHWTGCRSTRRACAAVLALSVVKARGTSGQSGSGQLRRVRGAAERVGHRHVHRVVLSRQLVLECRADRQIAVVRAHAVSVALAF